jgi:ADP-heptose:LPS heptosyltransferase
MDKLWVLKSLDAALGKGLVKLLSPRASSGRITRLGGAPGPPDPLAPLDAPGPARILVIRPGGIGDAVLLIPALRALRKIYPGARLDILCEKRNAGVFDFCACADAVYLYDSPGGLARCLSNAYSLVVDTEQWHRLSAVVARLTGAPVRAGFATNERAALFSHTTGYDHDDYEVESFFNLIKPLATETLFTPESVSGFKSVSRLKPLIGPETPLWPESLFTVDPDIPFVGMQEDAGGFIDIGAADDDAGGGLAAVFPGASVRERRWGGRNFGATAAALDGRGYRVLILGARADSVEAAEIMRIAPQAVDLTGRTTLLECARVLKSCRLLVTADSGLMHVAAAMGTPTVSLFGAGILKKWAPRGKRHRVISRRLPCSPCTRFGYTPECKIGVKCLSEITVEEVVEAAVSLL